MKVALSLMAIVRLGGVPLLPQLLLPSPLVQLVQGTQTPATHTGKIPGKHQSHSLPNQQCSQGGTDKALCIVKLVPKSQDASQVASAEAVVQHFDCRWLPSCLLMRTLYHCTNCWHLAQLVSPVGVVKRKVMTSKRKECA